MFLTGGKSILVYTNVSKCRNGIVAKLFYGLMNQLMAVCSFLTVAFLKNGILTLYNSTTFILVITRWYTACMSI